MQSPSTSTFLGRHQFLIYRLFSLSGLIPIGGYVVIHLLTNATVIDSPATFQEQVYRIHSLGVILPIVEWVFIFLPILFHATVGFIVIATGLPNPGTYTYNSNIRYTLQRATGMIAFAFIIWHVIHMHTTLGAPFAPYGGAQFDPHHATSTTATALQAALWVQILYAIGVLATVFHLANGLWTWGITWGIWTSDAAQRRAGYICAAFGIFLAVAGLSALVGMTQADVSEAQVVEDRMENAHKLLRGELEMADEHNR